MGIVATLLAAIAAAVGNHWLSALVQRKFVRLRSAYMWRTSLRAAGRALRAGIAVLRAWVGC